MGRLRKPQSKRITTRKRTKIERKVREHHRKARKEAKQNTHKKSRKDPGIPAMWPFKEETVEKMKEDKEKERQHQRNIQITARTLSEEEKLARLNADAAAKSAAFRPRIATAEKAIAGLADHSKKAFFREFKQVVDAADVILEVLDARDPLGCRARHVEEMILNSGSDKRIVLVLNKIDLVPRQVAEAWLRYLRNELPTVAFKASTQSQRRNLGQSKGNSESLLNSSECLGADTLIQLLKNYCRNRNIKTSINVGIVGYPNVGKSSLINSLKRAKVCRVGAAPGITTASQSVTLDKNIKLLDCPGIIFASDEPANVATLFLRNCLRAEQLADPIAAVQAVFERCNPEQLMLIYGAPRFENATEFLAHVARYQGKLKRGAIPDTEAAARVVLNDWNSGKIPFYTLPPAREGDHISATIVNAWAPEFDLATIESAEAEHVLPAVADLKTSNFLRSDGAVHSMETDAQPSTLLGPSAPAIVISSTTKARKDKTAKENDPPLMNDQELSANPQVNRDRKKLAKESKKRAEKNQRRRVTFGGQDQVIMMSEDDYDFATDFTPLPTRH